MQLIEAPLSVQQENKPPQFMYDQCAALKQSTTGNAAGHASATDLSGLPTGPFPQILGWRPKGIVAMTGYLRNNEFLCRAALTIILITVDVS